MELKTKRGLLTTYGLACGYAESREVGSDCSIRLWQEHGVYHVRMHHKYNGRIFWDSFATLGEARKRYRDALPIPGRLP